MTKRNFTAHSKEQVELLTDPFGLTILVALDAEDYKSVEKLKEETGENKDLIKEYLLRLQEAEMIESKEDNNKEFRKKADYYGFSSEQLAYIPEQIQDHWIFGLLHALQGDYHDFLTLAKEHEDVDNALKKAGYPPAKKSLKLFMNRIYLKQEDIDELNDKINNLLSEYSTIPENDKDEDYLVYDLNFFMKPYIPKFRNELEEDK